MPLTASVFKVLVAGPGDVDAERQVVAAAIEAWNQRHSDQLAIVMRAVGWEQARPEIGGDAQDIINQQQGDDCDAVIAVFGTRLGTATPRAISGTVEEIERAIAACKNVMVYFSTGDMPRQGFNQTQFKKLERFRKSLQGRGLLGTYSSLDDLRARLDTHLVSLGYEFERSIEEQDGAADSSKGSVRTRLGQGALQILSATVAESLAEGIPRASITKTNNPDLAWMSDGRFRAMLEELVRLGLLIIKLDRREAGVEVEVTEEGLDQGLRAIVPHFDENESRVRNAICWKSPTTVEEIATQLDLPTLLVLHIARRYAAQGMVSVNQLVDVTKINKPTSALCGWEDIRRRKACVVIGPHFPNTGNLHQQSFEIDLLNEGEHEAREIKVVWDLGDGFPEEGQPLPFVIPPMTSGPESRFHTGFSIPWPDLDEEGNPIQGQEKEVRLKVSYRDGLDERDEAIFTLILRNRPDPKRWTAEELRHKASLAPICQGSRMESR